MRDALERWIRDFNLGPLEGTAGGQFVYGVLCAVMLCIYWLIFIGGPLFCCWAAGKLWTFLFG